MLISITPKQCVECYINVYFVVPIKLCCYFTEKKLNAYKGLCSEKTVPWIKFKNSCYSFSTVLQGMSFDTAYEVCKNQGKWLFCSYQMSLWYFKSIFIFWNDWNHGICFLCFKIVELISQLWSWRQHASKQRSSLWKYWFLQ